MLESGHVLVDSRSSSTADSSLPFHGPVFQVVRLSCAASIEASVLSSQHHSAPTLVGHEIGK